MSRIILELQDAVYDTDFLMVHSEEIGATNPEPMITLEILEQPSATGMITLDRRAVAHLRDELEIWLEDAW